MSRVSASARQGDGNQATLQKLRKAAVIQVVKIKDKDLKIRSPASSVARRDASEGGK